MSLPSLESTTEALSYEPTKTGLTEFGKGMVSWRVKKPQELHKAPEGFDVLSMQELAQMRVDTLKAILHK
jgi:hypothetical protein